MKKRNSAFAVVFLYRKAAVDFIYNIEREFEIQKRQKGRKILYTYCKKKSKTEWYTIYSIEKANTPQTHPGKRTKRKKEGKKGKKKT